MLQKNDLAGLQALLWREKNSTGGASRSLLLLVDFKDWSGLHNVPVSWGAFVLGILFCIFYITFKAYASFVPVRCGVPAHGILYVRMLLSRTIIECVCCQ